MPIDITDAIENAGTSPFVDAEGKASLADNQTPFYIVKVEPKVDTQYGAQTMYHIKTKEWGRDETRILGFTHSDYRESKANNIKLAMDADPGSSAGPAYLGRYRTRNGHDAWELYATPQQTKSDTTAPITPATANPAPVASVAADDDIPF